MKKFSHIGAKAAKRVFVLLCLLAAFACSKSLDSVDGPEVGMVSGLVCNELPVLTAAMEVPGIQNTLVSEGKCRNLRTRAKVDFLRTVMMPGDGKYSQFEYKAEDKTLKLWIRTNNVH
jgi:hypothetical protein